MNAKEAAKELVSILNKIPLNKETGTEHVVITTIAYKGDCFIIHNITDSKTNELLNKESKKTVDGFLAHVLKDIKNINGVDIIGPYDYTFRTCILKEAFDN